MINDRNEPKKLEIRETQFSPKKPHSTNDFTYNPPGTGGTPSDSLLNCRKPLVRDTYRDSSIIPDERRQIQNIQQESNTNHDQLLSHDLSGSQEIPNLTWKEAAQDYFTRNKDVFTEALKKFAFPTVLEAFTNHVLEHKSKYWLEAITTDHGPYWKLQLGWKGGGNNSSDEEISDDDHAESSIAPTRSKKRRIESQTHTTESYNSSTNIQLRQELNSYSNTKALKAIKNKIDKSYLKIKGIEHKNDLGNIMSSIDNIIAFHQNRVDEPTGILALRKIQDTTKANLKTEKYYRDIQQIAQSPEQEPSDEQLRQELNSYSNTKALQAIKNKINGNYGKIKGIEHKNDLGNIMSSIDNIIAFHQNRVDEPTGILALRKIRDTTKANLKTEQHYRDIQQIAQSPEQEPSDEQMQQELNSYSNINELQAIKNRINGIYLKTKGIEHKNDLGNIMSSIDDIIAFHQNRVDEPTGILALRKIRDTTKTNNKTEQHYRDIQRIAQSPEQGPSDEQLRQELNSYSNTKALQAIKNKINGNYIQIKGIEHENDLDDIMSSIDDIIAFHQNRVDEPTGMRALRNIRDTTKANNKTDKYYQDIKRIVQSPEQEPSDEQLRQELNSYSNIKALKLIKRKIDHSYRKLKESDHKNDVADIMSSIDDIIGFHQNRVDEPTGMRAVRKIRDATKANNKTDKYYQDIKRIVQSPEQD